MSQARLIRALLLTTTIAGGLTVAGGLTSVHAEQAGIVRVAQTPPQVNKGTLAAAIAAADKFSGGKVVEIRYRKLGGASGFDAVAVKAGKFTHLRIDLPNYKVSTISQAEIPWRSNWTLKADAKSLAEAKLSLHDAVLQAEGLGGGPAVDAGVAAPLTADNSVLAYNVQVMNNGEATRVAIDAKSGAPIANPSQFLEGWNPQHNL